MPSDQDDIIFGAYVEDQTTKFFDRFDQRLDKMEDTSNSAMSALTGGLNKAGVAAGAVGGIVAGLVTKVMEVGIQLYERFDATLDQANQLRQRADTLAITLEQIGGNAGYSAEEMAQFEEEMRKTGISILATRDSLAKMIQADLDLTKAAELARVAQDAAVIAGTNSSDAFQRLLRAVQTTQPEILRSLGLVVNMQAEIKKWARENKVSAESVTYQQKQQIMLNAAIKAGINIQGSYVAALDSVGKKYGSLERIQEDLLVALGAIFQPFEGAKVDLMTKVLGELRNWLEENEEALISMGETAAAVFESIVKNVEWLIEQLTIRILS